MKLSEAIGAYQLCPGKKALTRGGVCDRRDGCPMICAPEHAADHPDIMERVAAKLSEPAPAKSRKKSPGPNKTELEYRRRFIDASEIPGVIDETVVSVAFEGLTFRLAAGYRYTPDWVVQLANGQIEAHEAKGPWQSRDAHLRWAQAAQEWPNVRFFWGKRDKNGTWKTEERNNGN